MELQFPLEICFRKISLTVDVGSSLARAADDVHLMLHHQ